MDREQIRKKQEASHEQIVEADLALAARRT